MAIYKGFLERRKKISKIINGNLNRLLVFIGPCSIHSSIGCIKFAKILKKNEEKFKNLLIVMRVFLEKPRTCSGWKGFVYDPDINDTYKVNKGIKISKKIIKKVNEIGVAVCTEFLNPFIKCFIEKYISVGFIGARNNESQVHREMASSLKIPVGFKNNTNCSIVGAINSIDSCKKKSFCFSIRKSKVVFKKNINNNECFLVLRGGDNITNFDDISVRKSIDKLKERGINKGLVIDFSHGNSSKNFKKQKEVCDDVCKQIVKNNRISGVMIESNLEEGSQLIKKGKISPYISITDSCISIKESMLILKKLDKSVEKRKVR
ncbi:2-keto-3-deoxy-D-arabino-heptulosonate-7- phosphate synthase I alpha [Candidatus Vidania fulgoroideae]|nr:2-keto-3-deoxy-D-arabino-heptulosonate-7- phosphate synthase I alpha [Candidatus Vidania fulgoroideae]